MGDKKINNSITKKGKNDMDKTVVQIIKSGNRFNAWDKDGNKFTSDITIGARKKAFKNGTALERRINKSGNKYWWAVPMS